MRKEGLTMIHEIIAKMPPRWLTLWGRNGRGNGTGKTFLSRGIMEASKGALSDYTPSVKFCHWPTLCDRMQSHEDTAHSFAFCEMAGLLVIDDIGAEHQTGAMIAKLCRLMDARLRKWTILTTNLNPDEWQKRDSRISSRIVRGLNRHVQCETMDYALRPKSEEAKV